LEVSGFGVAVPQLGDAVGCGPAGGLGAAADDRGDLLVGEAGQVVVGDRFALLARQGGQGVSQVQVGRAGLVRGRVLGQVGERDGAAGGGG